MTARFPTRCSACAAALLALPLVLVAGAAPLAAQQQVEVITTRRPRPESGGGEQVLRQLRARADSLARIFGNEELSVSERQQAGDALDRAFAELERAEGLTTTVRAHVGPMRDPRAAERMSRALTRSGPQGAAPRGWLGIVVNGLAREPRLERGELIVHYLTYPEILTVEPSSPAERAGLVPGDTLIAYDGRDVRGVDISMTRLLRPNARVQVRIARDGRHRDVPVTIADAPSRIVLRAQEMTPMGVARAADPMSSVAGAFPRAPRPPVPAGAAVMRRTMMATTAPSAPVAPPPPAGLAGAQMGSITPEWARLTGVPHGVLVLRAPVGSLAAESGLRDADVIVKAAGRDVRTLTDLRELLAMAWGSGDRALAIEYVRERKARSGVLRW